MSRLYSNNFWYHTKMYMFWFLYRQFYPWQKKFYISLFKKYSLAAHRGGKRHTAPGERAPKLRAAWTAQTGEGTKCRRNRIRAFVEDPKTGTALNAGPAPYRAAGSLSSVDGESTDTLVRGKPSVAGSPRVLPTHSSICLQSPALPAAGLNWTSEPK